MQARNDSFPYMTDDVVQTFWDALGLPEEERTDAHKRAIEQERNGVDLLILSEIMDTRRGWHI